jgi:hypothetical protein
MKFFNKELPTHSLVSLFYFCIAVIGFFAPVLSVFAAENTGISEMITKYDHPMHIAKVFNPLNIECSHCHNFAIDKATGRAIPNNKLNESIFKLPLKEICHECHRSAETKYETAPKACYTCHRGMTNLSAVRPENHNNISWKNSHATEARVAGDSCMNCHMSSQCVKCHTQRNDVELRNHSRNFRFMHSVYARLQPQKCDSCHMKSFCTNCHLGKR